jgi:hypothetical protein
MASRAQRESTRRLHRTAAPSHEPIDPAMVEAASDPTSDPDDARTTWHPIPEILLDETKLEQPVVNEKQVMTIEVWKAQVGAGYGWLANVPPEDVATKQDLLARWGAGLYKLTGRSQQGTIVKVRASLAIGDYNPAGQGAQPTAAAGTASSPTPAAAAAGGGPVAAGVALLSVISAAVVPIVTAIMKASADADERRQRYEEKRAEDREREDQRREERRRRDDEERRVSDRQANQTMLELVTKLQSARVADLENLLKGASDAHHNGTSKMPPWFVEMLDLQRATYTDLIETAQGKSEEGLDALVKLATSVVAGFREGQKADVSTGVPNGVATTPTG